MNITDIFRIAIEKGASDIHIVTGYYPTIRVNGELVGLQEFPLLDRETISDFMTPILNSKQLEILQLNREIDLGYDFENHRFRVNLYFAKGSLCGSFRLIPDRIMSLAELNMPEAVNNLSQINQGFILVTGPTGEGKSTTLASLIDIINQTKAKHILTIEDPIEYVYKNAKSVVSQREVGQDTHSWDASLKSALREDPDVVLIGEMRDHETIAAALTIAETGHLVFSTVHTNSAPQTIDRIIDVFPAHQQEQVRIQLSSSLKAIVSQRLLPNINGDGRIPACEILINTPAVASIIREGKTHLIDNVIQTSSDLGMLLLENNLADLYRNGKISKQTALGFAIRANEITRLIE